MFKIKSLSVKNFMSVGNVAFESVDQIVTNQLTAITSDHYDNGLLLDIYRNL